MSNEKQIQSFISSLETDSFPATLAGHYIAGEWGFPEDPTSEVSSICPSTGITLASSCANKHDVKNAINCAYEFHLSGQHNDFDARIERVSRFKEAFKSKLSLITRVATREQGKPLWEATHEINESLEYMDWVSKNGDFIKAQLIGPARLGHLTAEFRQKPAGVTAAYLPFSTTISTFCFYYVASLLSNCPMVMFSSKHNLLQAQLLSSIIASTGEDPAAFQMILSGFSEFRQALSDRRVAAVLYTGSRDHCDEIRDDSSSFPERRLILQSGGKNTAIIDESADMQLAVNMVLTGAFRSSGQLCSSTHRVAIHESRFEEFKTMTRKALREMEVGPTHLPDYNPFMGPLYSEKAVERYLRYQTMAAREADESITWGKAFTPEKSEEGQGFFVKPGVHLLKEVTDTSYQKSVILCPDLAVYKYTDISNAVEEIVNNTKAAFAVSYFGDKASLDEISPSIDAPNILHNLPTTEVEACLPLAGRYASGFHRFHGPSLAHYLLHPSAHQKREDVVDKISGWPTLV